MRSRPQISALLAAAITALGSTVSVAASLDLDTSVFKPEPADPQQLQLTSGLDLSLNHNLFDVDLGYDFRVHRNELLTATDDNTAQHLAGSLKIPSLDRLLGVQTHLRADSVFRTAHGAYDHRVSPGFSRKLLNLATLDVNYQYHLNKASAEAVPLAHRGYNLGLRGSLIGGKLNWSGGYIAADTYRESDLLSQSSETFRFQSAYQLLPQMQVQVSSALTERTQIHNAGSTDFLQTQYGAGLRWTPAANYSLNVNVHQTGLSHTGEHVLLRSGTLSWAPRQDMTLSVNYGDQLVEGQPGILLNTRLRLDRF